MYDPGNQDGAVTSTVDGITFANTGPSGAADDIVLGTGTMASCVASLIPRQEFVPRISWNLYAYTRCQRIFAIRGLAGGPRPCGVVAQPHCWSTTLAPMGRYCKPLTERLAWRKRCRILARDYHLFTYHPRHPPRPRFIYDHGPHGHDRRSYRSTFWPPDIGATGGSSPVAGKAPARPRPTSDLAKCYCSTDRQQWARSN